MQYRKIRGKGPDSSPFSRPKFESRLKQLKLGYIAYNLFSSALWFTILDFFLICYRKTWDKSLLLAIPLTDARIVPCRSFL
jgi:hypothetical protein